MFREEATTLPTHRKLDKPDREHDAPDDDRYERMKENEGLGSTADRDDRRKL
jgi:hypothetical protein